MTNPVDTLKEMRESLAAFAQSMTDAARNGALNDLAALDAAIAALSNSEQIRTVMHIEHEGRTFSVDGWAGPMVMRWRDAALSGGEAAAWHSMGTAPRDGTVIVLRFGQDGESPGWWDCPVSPIQNDDGTWPRMDDGHPWAFFDRTDDRLFLNHMTDRDQYGPSHWRPYTTPRIPDGMVLVPREPTEAMLRAEDSALPDDNDMDPYAHGKASWAAMLAALPGDGSAQGATPPAAPREE